MKKTTRRKRTGKPRLPSGIEPILIDRNQAAKLLGVSWLTLSVWSDNGVLRPVELPSSSRRRRPGDKRLRRVLYSVADLRAFIEQARARG